MVEMKHLLKIIMLMVLVGSISGCSELEEIEERGFVVGAAYDIVKKEIESDYERDVSDGASQ